jgi:hypothetical protein
LELTQPYQEKKNLTFSNPFLNTSNTISLKCDNTKLNVDASGNLTVIGGTSQWTTSGSNIYYNTGNVGIGTTNPLNILQVGDAGRLRIGSGITDYTIIGTRDTDDNTLNTKIFINGNTCTTANAAGSIPYFATSATGAHIFYKANSEKMRIDDNVSTSGYIFAGGTATGLRINGNDYGNTIYQNATTIGGNPANVGFTLEIITHLIFMHFQLLVCILI